MVPTTRGMASHTADEIVVVPTAELRADGLPMSRFNGTRLMALLLVPV